MTDRPVSLATLLRIDPRDRAGLRWIKTRARFWITGLKRRRKHLPRCGYSPEEMALFQALLALEAAAGRLLEIGRTGPCGSFRAVRDKGVR